VLCGSRKEAAKNKFFPCYQLFYPNNLDIALVGSALYSTITFTTQCFNKIFAHFNKNNCRKCTHRTPPMIFFATLVIPEDC
jgi:hypothetical protein